MPDMATQTSVCADEGIGHNPRAIIETVTHLICSQRGRNDSTGHQRARTSWLDASLQAGVKAVLDDIHQFLQDRELNTELLNSIAVAIQLIETKEVAVSKLLVHNRVENGLSLLCLQSIQRINQKRSKKEVIALGTHLETQLEKCRWCLGPLKYGEATPVNALSCTGQTEWYVMIHV